jgi:predicted transcriptional regulator of viral defense system
MRRTALTIEVVKRLGRQVFTSREIADLSGKSASAVTQSLRHLERHGVVHAIHRGVWAEVTDRPLSPYTVITQLFPDTRVYVSFFSALHLHGIISQIPQVVTLASLRHSRTVHTSVGVYEVHRLSPEFFAGFDWYKGTGSFLIAEPEKALADCLYLSTRRKNQFGHFPELELGRPFSIPKVRAWLSRIPDPNIRTAAERKLAGLLRVPARRTV